MATVPYTSSRGVSKNATPLLCMALKSRQKSSVFKIKNTLSAAWLPMSALSVSFFACANNKLVALCGGVTRTKREFSPVTLSSVKVKFKTVVKYSTALS